MRCKAFAPPSGPEYKSEWKRFFKKIYDGEEEKNPRRSSVQRLVKRELAEQLTWTGMTHFYSAIERRLFIFLLQVVGGLFDRSARQSESVSLLN